MNSRQSATTTALELAAARQQRPRPKRVTLRVATAGMAEMLKSRRLTKKEVEG